MDSRTETELFGSNERFLGMVTKMAQGDPKPPFEFCRAIGQRLVTLDALALRRMAQRPFLLLAFRLDDAPWWRTIADGPSSSLTDTPSPTAWASHFPRAEAVEIVRGALVLAWHRASFAPFRATLNLGASQEVIKILERTELKKVERVAEIHLEVMQPRWADNFPFWRRLIDAAESGNSHEMEFVDRLAAQLLATDMLIKR